MKDKRVVGMVIFFAFVVLVSSIATVASTNQTKNSTNQSAVTQVTPSPTLTLLQTVIPTPTITPIGGFRVQGGNREREREWGDE